MTSFNLLILVAHNLGHGPERDEGLRFAQIQEMMTFVFKHFQAGQCELFMSRAAAILEEMQEDLPDDVLKAADRPAALWNFLKDQTPFTKKEYKVNTARFMAFQRANYKLLKEWSLLLFKTEFLALELDMAKGKDFREKVLVRQSLLREAAELNTTSNQVLQLDSKLLRSACQNNVVVTMMTLGIPRHRRLLALTTAAAKPVDKWHGSSNKACRSVQETSDFMAAQVVSRVRHYHETHP